MTPVETVLGIGGRMKESSGGVNKYGVFDTL
jgi:hypothetical protein